MSKLWTPGQSPDESDDEKRFTAFTAEAMLSEQEGERATFQVGPFTLIVLIGGLQLATRHPHVVGENRKIMLGLVRDLGVFFKGTVGEEIVNRGSHPEWDIKCYQLRDN